MDEESKNWFRFSRLIIDVGPDILRKCVLGRSQARFLDDLEDDWHEKVQTILTIKYVSMQWTKFYKELEKKDDALQKTLKPLLTNWKSGSGENPTISSCVDRLNEWKNDIEKRLKNDQTEADALLLSWFKQIETRIYQLNAMPRILQSCTTELSDFFQRSRLDLMEKFKEHYDDFLSLCKDRTERCKYMTKHLLMEEIQNLENDRNKKQTTWNEVLNNYLQTLGEGIKHILESRKQTFPSIDEIEDLKNLVNEFEAKANSLDTKQLQESCDIWHLELGNLFNRWIETINKVTERRMLPVESFVNELKLFPSISLHHVKGVLNSIERTLKKNTSKQQMSKLFPPSGFPQLQNCDTSLLYNVLTCLVYPPIDGWHEDPPQFDQSIGADIRRLKCYRNDIVGHIEKTKIDRWEFDVLWKSVKDVLCRLASRLGSRVESQVRSEVDKIKTCSFDSNKDEEFKRILQWCKNDILEEFKGIAKLNQCLNILDSVERIQRQRPPSPPIDRNRGFFGTLGDGVDFLFGNR